MKNKKMLVIIIISAAVLLAAGGAAAAYLSKTTSVAGERISVYLTELDLNGRGENNLSGLARCKSLEKLDIRGNEITAEQFDAISAANPDCDILWSVPIGTEYFDSNITGFTYAADYVDDLYNIKYFTEISTADVTGTHADDERLHELNMRIPGIDVIWTATTGKREYRTDAEELKFDASTIGNPSFLRYFTKVKSLSAIDCGITDLSVISEMTKLEKLNLNGNSFYDISVLAEFKELRELDISDTYSEEGKKDLSCLAELPKLEVLNLAYCGANDYSYLDSMPSLRVLNLKGCFDKRDDMSILSKLTGLEELTLGDSVMNDDLPYLSGLTNLKSLDLSWIRISDPTPLYNLTSLKKLDISYCRLTKPQIEELKRALPECKVSS